MKPLTLTRIVVVSPQSQAFISFFGILNIRDPLWIKLVRKSWTELKILIRFMPLENR